VQTAHPSWRRLFVAIGIAIVAIDRTLVADSSPQAKPDLRARFLQEAAPEWTKLEAMVQCSQGTFTDHSLSYLPTSKGTRPREFRNTVKYYFNRTRGVAKYVSLGSPDDGTGTVVSYHGDYLFDLQIVKQDKGLRRYVNSFEPASLVGRDDWLDNSLGDLLLIAKCPAGLDLHRLVDGQRGAIVSIAPVEVNGKAAAKVEYNRIFPRSTKVYPGSLILDPAFHWAVMSYEQTYGWGKLTGRVEYQRQINDLAFPSKIFEREVNQKGQVLSDDRYDFAPPEASRTQLADYSLESYGLKPPAQNTYLPVGILYGVLISFIFVLSIAVIWLVVVLTMSRQKARRSGGGARAVEYGGDF
jgi:hypothetical protein